MSTYYEYYLGYESKEDGKIYPLGPYDDKQKLHPAGWWSRSFAARDLYESFKPIPADKISTPLRERFEYKDWNDKPRFDLNYLYASELPGGDGITHGYLPRESVETLLKSDDYFEINDLRYDMLTPEEFALRAQYELEHGEPMTIHYDDGEEEKALSCKEYVFYSYLDRCGVEYQSFVIRTALDMFEFSDALNKEDAKPVILLDIC